MAKKTVTPQVLPEESQEEMTVVIFKLKGQSSTLQKGFEAINTAFSSFGATLPAVAPVRRIAVGTVTKDTGSTKADEVDETDEIDPEGDGEIIDAPTRQTATKPQKATPRPKPKFLPDFDLNLSNKPWKEFANERAPKTEMTNIYWLLCGSPKMPVYLNSRSLTSSHASALCSGLSRRTFPSQCG